MAEESGQEGTGSTGEVNNEGNAGEQSSEETQSSSTQEQGQVDTSNEGSLSDEMGISGEEQEGETSSEPMSIDAIVAEALTGEISEETQKLIEENGLGGHLDLLVAGHEAMQAKSNQEVFEVVGGEDSYGEMQEWGKNNMNQQEQEAYNSALFSGNMELAKLAVIGLQAKYEGANGKKPSRVIEGGGSSNESNRPFSDVSEYIAITRSTQYKRDPEFKAQVEAKRNLSGF